MFGNKIKTVEEINVKVFCIFLTKTSLNFKSKNNIAINESKKYIAAYFAINAMPKKIPNNAKLINFGLFLIFNNKSNDIVQKKIKIISVDIKKEETVTTGIK